MVSKIGDAIDKITLCALNSTDFGPLDRRIMSAVGELSKSRGIVEREGIEEWEGAENSKRSVVIELQTSP